MRNIEYLSKIAEILPGYPFRGAIKDDPQGEVTVLQMRDTSIDEAVKWGLAAKATLKGRRSPDYLIDNDIVFVARGQKNYSTMLTNVPEQAVITPQFFLVRANQSLIEPSFLAWQMNQAPARKYFKEVSAGTTSASIRKPDLEDLPIVLPSMHKQLQIMRIVDCGRRQLDAIRKMAINQETFMAAIANNVLK